MKKETNTPKKTISTPKIDSSVIRTKKKHAIKKNNEQDVQYVLPLGNGWIVKRSKRKVFTVITETKKEAIQIARSLAQTKHIPLIVHGRDGKVELEEQY